MQVARSTLIRHLSRISCGDQVPEVVLTGNFAASALAADEMLFVNAEGLDGVEPLTEPVGVDKLKLLIRSMGALGEDEKQDLSIEFDDGRIVISEKNRGVVRLVSSLPKYISTAVSEDVKKKILAQVDGKKPVPLPQSLVESVTKMIDLLKAETVSFEVTAKGTTVCVGSGDADNAEIPLPNSKVGKKADEYAVRVDAGILKAVFEQITDYTQAELVLGGGADELIMVRDVGIQYFISPIEEKEEKGETAST